MPLAPGQILQNRYQILGLLGQGGMGSVYRAFDHAMNRTVAVKERIPDPNATPQGLQQARAQFQREAQILGALSHPNLPQCYDFFSSGGNEYVVMELIEGQSLDQVVRQQGAVDEPTVRIWAEQILNALTYIHGRNIIHRDIKPANVIRKPDGSLVLVDFGLVKLFDPNNPYTATVMRGMGTPEYAPLEQFSPGMHTDARSDVYSLGAMLYHLVCGRPPLDVPHRLMNPKQQPSPRAIIPSISQQMETVILKAMEVYPQNRYQSAPQMRDALHAHTPIIPMVMAILLGFGLVCMMALGLVAFLWFGQPTPTSIPVVLVDATAIRPGSPTAAARQSPTELPISIPTWTSVPIPTRTFTPVPTSTSRPTLTPLPPPTDIPCPTLGPPNYGIPAGLEWLIPRVDSWFSVSERCIKRGAAATLSWNVAPESVCKSFGNVIVTFDGREVGRSGSVQVRPMESRDYVFTADLKNCAAFDDIRIRINVIP